MRPLFEMLFWKLLFRLRNRLPQMVKEPRSNPYMFYREDEVPGGFERDIADYRKKHAR